MFAEAIAYAARWADNARCDLIGTIGSTRKHRVDVEVEVSYQYIYLCSESSLALVSTEDVRVQTIGLPAMTARLFRTMKHDTTHTFLRD